MLLPKAEKKSELIRIYTKSCYEIYHHLFQFVEASLRRHQLKTIYSIRRRLRNIHKLEKVKSTCWNICNQTHIRDAKSINPLPVIDCCHVKDLNKRERTLEAAVSTPFVALGEGGWFIADVCQFVLHSFSIPWCYRQIFMFKISSSQRVNEETSLMDCQRRYN